MTPKKPHVSSRTASARSGEQDTVEIDGKSYNRGWKSVVIYDDTAEAEALAAKLGVVAKHAAMKGSPFKTISVVPFDG